MKKLECMGALGKRVCFISNDGRLEFIGKVEKVYNEESNYGVLVRNPTCYFLNKKGVHVDKGITSENEYHWVYFLNQEEQPYSINSWFLENDIRTRNVRLDEVKNAKQRDYSETKNYNHNLYEYVTMHIKADSFNNISVKTNINTIIEEGLVTGKEGKTIIDIHGETTIAEPKSRGGKTAVATPNGGNTSILETKEGRTVVGEDKHIEGKTVIPAPNDGQTTVNGDKLGEGKTIVVEE